jgi:transcriptional regulator
MYQPAHFAVNDPDRLLNLIEANPLATIVRQGEGGLDADHIPLLVETNDDGLLLCGHVARANPLARQDGVAVLAVFNGPDAYVSPAWYPSKTADPRVVPTWNYVVAHARGTLRTIDDAGWIRRHVATLSAWHETAAGSDWTIDDAPADFIDRLVGAIVGIEITVTKLEGKFKLSQNRSEADRLGAVAGLRSVGRGKATLLAGWMAAGAL